MLKRQLSSLQGMENKMADQPVEKRKRHLTGKHVIYWVIGFFAVIFIANGFFVYYAVSTFRGEDSMHPYQQGIDYNQTLAERRAQAASGWTAEIDLEEGRLELKIRNGDGTYIPGLKVTGVLKHPTETDLDIPLTFAQTEANTYIVSIPPEAYGHEAPGKEWDLHTVARKPDGSKFKTRNELWLKQ